MDQIERGRQLLAAIICGGTALGTILVIAYFRYGKSRFFTALGDAILNLGFVQRDRRDLLMFALLPYSMAALAVVCLIMLI